MTYVTTSSGGSGISNINDVYSLMQNTTLKPINTWDEVVGSTFVGGTPIPFVSPTNAQPYFADWDFCYDIFEIIDVPFETFVTTINFGKVRGTTQYYTLPARVFPYTLKAYFQIASYPTGEVIYKTPVVTGTFVSDFIG